MKQNIIKTLEKCVEDLKRHIMENEDYGYAEDALQSLENTVECLRRGEHE